LETKVVEVVGDVVVEVVEVVVVDADVRDVENEADE
jgi:hypothetical protein